MQRRGVLSKQNRVLLYELVKTDFKLRYQGSFLGIVWSVLKPLLLFAVMYMVFVHFLKFTDGTPQYPIVLLLGITLWAFFSEATSVGMQSIVGRGDILRKINFPKYIIILSAMTSSLISLSINLVVVIIFALATGIQFTGLALLAPINILQLFILAFGCSLILSTLYVKFRDIGHIWEVVAQILFYATPIFYPLTMVAGRELFGVSVSQLIMLNPLAQTIQDARHNLISPTTVPTTWEVQTNAIAMAVPLIITALILGIGIWYFSRNSKRFAEIM
ncbi:MAG: ABC transporter permease [Candidatus Saccharibacteria bacterium]|nr:ABC transporter permease [Candidatus Saccharibacteria bacterium]